MVGEVLRSHAGGGPKRPTARVVGLEKKREANARVLEPLGWSRAHRCGPSLDNDPSATMTLWTFCQSMLLTFNAFAILNEPRFLEKYGLGQSSLTSGYVSSTSPRGQLIGLITATQYMRGASDPPPPPPSVRSSPPGSLVAFAASPSLPSYPVLSLPSPRAQYPWSCSTSS